MNEGRRFPLPGKSLADGLRHAIAPRPAFEATARKGHDCSLCPRRNLPDLVAFWNHMRMRHHPTEIARHVDEAQGGQFEEALVKVVNSVTHDDAIRIASAALLGERE
jgi:hypothetical protein